jgi:hypothetical protein
VRNRYGMDFELIKAGSFVMGSTDEAVRAAYEEAR